MIRVSELSYQVGDFALQDVSLEVEDGEYFVLLGPTGSGKTMLLECLCGLNRIGGGRVEVAGRDVTHLEPRDRGIGYLPQDYALFPHLTVVGNVSFGLAVRRLPAEEVGRRVGRALELTKVSHLSARYPEYLSGGEKQRVALARALAVEPRVLLLDEPVSALDEQSRDRLCRGLKQLHRTVGTTTVHVCHNLREMLTVADRVAIIADGRLRQVGTPSEVLERPADRFVAEFVEAQNIIAARATIDGPRSRLTTEGGLVCWSAQRADGTVHFVVRPESICVHRSGWNTYSSPAVESGVENVLAGRVADVLDLGAVVYLTVQTDAGLSLAVSLGKSRHRELGAVVGNRVFLAFPAEAVHIVRE
jgi:molybdate/tungstate transport system ATP-binding protein